MKKLNKENYESYLIDFLEGNLEEEACAALKKYIEENPEIKEEYETLISFQTELKVPAEETKMDFSFLKKDESRLVSEEEMIAAIEGDLSEEKLWELKNNIASDPSLQREFELFQLSRLQNEPIVFKGKNKLKKSIPLYAQTSFRVASIAAVLLAFVILGIIYFGSNQTQLMDQSAINAKPTPLDKTIEQPESIVNTKKMGIKRHEKGIQKFQSNAAILITNKAIELPLAMTQRTVNSLPVSSELEINTPQRVDYRLAINNSKIAEPEFKKPEDWFIEKMKKQFMGNQQADSLTANETAGNIALNLVEKTTGISIKNNKDEETGVKGFAIISKYFAYERITHQ